MNDASSSIWARRTAPCSSPACRCVTNTSIVSSPRARRDVEHPLGRQHILLGGVPVNVSAGAYDRQPARERQLVADQRQPGPFLDVRALGEREHAAGRQARGLAAGAARGLEPVEDLAPPLVVEGFLQGDDVEARQAFGDRLGAFGDVRLVTRPFAQHVAKQRQVRRDELDVVAGHPQRPAGRDRIACAGIRAIGAAGHCQGAGQEQRLALRRGRACRRAIGAKPSSLMLVHRLEAGSLARQPPGPRPHCQPHAGRKSRLRDRSCHGASRAKRLWSARRALGARAPGEQ